MKLLTAAVFAVATTTSPARAQAPVANQVPAAAKPARGSKPTKPVEPHLAAPQVALSLDAPTTRGSWTMRVTNQGDVPVRIVADARLLALEVTRLGARRPVHCELPADMRPGDDLERPLVLPPKRSYAETFEPRLYCFGAGGLAALAPGAIVVARLGWAGATTRPPYEASPIDGVEPQLAALKSLDAPPIGLPDEPTASPAPPQWVGEGGVTADIPRLALTGATAVDSESAEALEIPVSLTNNGSRAVIVRFRPETLAFDVVGPMGVQTCTWPVMASAPIREAYSTLPPKGTLVLSVLLSAYCKDHAFDQAGLFVVRPVFDARAASGASVGVLSFDGVVIATTPTVVRLRRGLVPTPVHRPHLEPR